MGLRLWLQADVGTTVDQNGRLSSWQDQSGLGNDALQGNASLQPTLSQNSISGLPAVHFSGGQTISLPNFMNGATAGEIFIVLRCDPYTPGTIRGFMRIGSNAYNAHYPLTGGVIADNFGSTTRQDAAGTPEQDLSQYHIYNAISTSSEWTSRINGTIFYSTSSNTVGFSTSPQIGQSQSWYFAGDIAEILVYDRELSDPERDAVVVYLGSRYPDIAPSPSIPTGLNAVSVSGTQISVTWDYPLTSRAPTQFYIERKTAQGDYLPVATMSDATAYFDAGLTPNETYTYRIQAQNFKGVSSFSAIATEVHLPAQSETEMPFDGIRIWLKADASSANFIRRWPDQAGNGADAIQYVGTRQPVYVADSLNGRPAVHFSGAQYLTLPDFMQGASAGEMFAVVRADPYTSSTIRGFMRMGSNVYNAHYPLTGGVIADNFGSTTRKDGAGAPVQDLGQYLLYDATSAPNDWMSRISGLPYYAVQSNIVGFSITPQLGLSQSYYFAGDMAEILIYDHALTEDERLAVGHYLAGKYPDLAGPAPVVPAGFVADLVSSTQAYLGWGYALPNYNITFVIERSESGSPFVELTRIRNEASFLDSGLQPDTEYRYRVRAISEAGESEYSVIASIRTEDAGAEIPLSGIRLWLAADSITTNPVRTWVSSGPAETGVMALQANPVLRPSLVADALHGKPAVHFDGTKYLSLPDFMSGASAGEMFVVLRCDPYNSGTIRGFMRIGSDGNNAHYPLSGSIKDSFGSTVRQDGSGIALQDLSQFHIYNAVSVPGGWTNRVNGILNYTTAVNTVGWSTLPRIGLSQSYYFAGDIAEMIVYDHRLNADEEAAIQKYLSVKYTILDPDNDGLDGDEELAIGTDPNNWDSNGNGLADGPEYFAGYDPINQDTDGDRVSNAEELTLGTDPFLADTDHDGVLDGEDAFPLDPTRWDPPDSGDPNDHIPPVLTLIEPAGAILLL
jgi:hypothetical protein